MNRETEAVVGIETAIEPVTIDAAYACRQDGTMGSPGVGKAPSSPGTRRIGPRPAQAE